MPNKNYGYLLVLLFVYRPVSADIYKWTSRDGVVHYSESAPDTLSEKASQFDLASIPLMTVSLPAYQATLELARVLENSRLEREKMRMQKQRNRSYARSAELESKLIQRGSDYRYPVYYPPVSRIYHPGPDKRFPPRWHSFHTFNRHAPRHGFNDINVIHHPRVGSRIAIVQGKQDSKVKP